MRLQGTIILQNVKVCWVDDTLRTVRVTEARELLTDVDTRAEFLARRKTLTGILQSVDSRDSNSEL